MKKSQPEIPPMSLSEGIRSFKRNGGLDLGSQPKESTMKHVRNLLVISLCIFPAGRVVAQPPIPETPRQQFDKPGFASSYPLYCQGPLVTSSGTTPMTTFKWSWQGAGAAGPGPGECAWADRGPRGSEIKSGDGNVLSGSLSLAANLPAGQYAKIGVHHDPKSDDLVVLQVVLVAPPFSAVPEAVQTYVPLLMPLNRVEPVVPEEAKEISGEVVYADDHRHDGEGHASRSTDRSTSITAIGDRRR